MYSIVPISAVLLYFSVKARLMFDRVRAFSTARTELACMVRKTTTAALVRRMADMSHMLSDLARLEICDLTFMNLDDLLNRSVVSFHLAN